VSIPDDRTGEAVQAWVVPREGHSVTGQEILDSLHGYLARFKWPKDVQVVEELPHHVTGKVLRRVFRGEEILSAQKEALEETSQDQEPAPGEDEEEGPG
jgi:long-chain acyl-CoA synthetase